MRLRTGPREFAFTPDDILNPEEFDPTAGALAIVQDGLLRAIVFCNRRGPRLTYAMQLAARYGRLRRLAAALNGRPEIWVDCAGGAYDVTNLELFQFRAAAFLGPGWAPCASKRGEG